jgi:hypothetical protein
MVFSIIAAVVIEHCSVLSIREMFFVAINFSALNNLLQMFTNTMNLNGNKPPILPPLPLPTTGTSSNLNVNSQHGSNQTLNLQEQQQQQQHTLNSPRSTHPPNTGVYNNESSLLMCATGAYNSAGPSPNNTGGPPANHHAQNGGLTPSTSTTGNSSYPPTMPSLYANSASPLSNGGAGIYK